jgi:hypothetical protein
MVGATVVVDDFLPPELAEVLRMDIADHFAAPEEHGPERQVWNFRYAADRDAYLLTAPEKVIARAQVADFQNRLQNWSVNTLGLAQVSWPGLSLYVGGCRQGPQHDAAGRGFGFIYALTRNTRLTTGGQTLVHREIEAGDPDSIEPRFNRLMVFDARTPHAVGAVEGSMDPREGHIVLHGHLGDGGPIVAGALSADAVAALAAETVRAFAAGAVIDGYDGFLSLRLDILPDGAVASCRVLIDRVLHSDPANGGWPELASDLVGRFAGLSFPAAAGPSVFIVPVSFGAPAPPPAA